MSSLWPALDSPSLEQLAGGAVLLMVCGLWWRSTRRPPGLPPGPGPALPLLGHLWMVAKDPRGQFQRWRGQYGDIFSLLMGGKVLVVLASYPAMKEAFLTLAHAFSDRPLVFVMEELFKTKGVIGASGATWKEQRKTMQEILRQMGVGKNMLVEKVQEEIQHFLQALQAQQGQPVDIQHMTQISMANNICSITLGRRYDYQDPEFISYFETMDEFLKYTAGSNLLNYLPILGDLPGDPFNKKATLANIEAVNQFLAKHVAEHKAILQQGQMKKTDFIFSYLQQIEERQRRGELDTALNEAGLLNVVNDLFLAGSETVSAVLRWAFLYLVRHPDVQEKCYLEICQVLGPDRAPTTRDKPNMTYLEATVCECMRKADIIPFVLHTASQEVRLRDFVIPKDAVVMADISCALGDPDLWGDPENFRPERFLDSEGKLIRQDVLVPFGLGRRLCVGEAMSRMELFLYLGNLIQHFRFLPGKPGDLPPTKGVFGQLHHPQPFQIRAVPRK